MIEMGLDPDAIDDDDDTKTEILPEEEETVEDEEEEVEEEENAGEEDDEAPPPPPPEEPEEDEPEVIMPAISPSKAAVKIGGRPKKLVNSFNFSERAALTYNNPMRSQEVQTTPPPLATFSANVLQWVIYDAYQADYEAQQLEKELEKERKEKEKASTSRARPVRKAGKVQLSEAVQGRVLECWRVLERMINLNSYTEIAKDYRYWDDPSDEFRVEEGTLLPLWKFMYDKTKTHTVTDLDWNPYYYDLFTVCFGFFDFVKPINNGAVCLFTIKNPSFPDYICITDSAVMCADIHPKYCYMVVIGQYDGAVLVFNVQQSCKDPIFKSNNVTNKHRGIVWEIKWGPDLPDGELNFFSVSADGKVNNWVLMQNELMRLTIINLYLDQEAVAGPDGTKFRLKSCASCIKFHPDNPQIYLVGTEEGLIYKCSTQYSSLYLLTYKAHDLPISRMDFNRYNRDIFISASYDWRVKIWDDQRLEPLFSFDLGDRVGDVKWAPYSSTVFAAVTTEGKVYVFDLNINKYKPICVQAVVSKRRNKLTRLAFNPKLPIIIVGDDKGCVTTLKLSPNLRIPCKAPKKQQHLDQWTLQCMKLDKLLSLVREPVTLSLPSDTAGLEED
ncbi:unnamed protein product [Brassicogethes aeneus]|uniref:Dynein intermediate chain 2, ciliary n=1 Tax=Brassicogethes aeneus TaxID=1431903 RepID=A0A9P0AYN2_BRAAE|nr:unnamed protein product [Brassicogethes aeneus]